EAFGIEAQQLVPEELAAGARVIVLYTPPVTEHQIIQQAVAARARHHDLAPGVMERASDTATPQPFAAVVSTVDVTLDALDGAELIVVCVDVRDPGNLGTVLRSAEAAGAGGVICCEGSVDVYSPKTLRASAGSLLHVPVVAWGDPP